MSLIAILLTMTFRAVTSSLALVGLHFSGPDAQAFLQGQFTNDVKALSPPIEPGGACPTQLTGYCSPKGRLLGLGWLLQPAAQDYLWVLPEEIVEGIEKRLKMFVMRSKLTVGRGPEAFLGVMVDPPLDHPAVGEAQPFDAGLLLIRKREGAGLLVGAADRLAAHTQSPHLPNHAWWAQEAEAGRPWIWASTQEVFVPQMLNLDLIAGVSFTKGCYPGQEVVARSQYLGKLHRRMFGLEILAASETDRLQAQGLLPGQALVAAQDPGQPVGQLASPIYFPAESGPDALRGLTLAEVTLDAWAQLAAGAVLELEGLAGLRVRPRALPYSVPTEVQQPNRPRL